MDRSRYICTTPIHRIKSGRCLNNELYVKRDDLLPFSFGGNKVRIGYSYITDMYKSGRDCMILYGNSYSNLCRVTANMCVSEGIDCYMVSVIDDDRGAAANNGIMVSAFGTHIVRCMKSEVDATVKKITEELQSKGRRPYYIRDSYGITAAEDAYAPVYAEIEEYEERSGLRFDYIFVTSGSGTTQTGLVCGEMQSSTYASRIYGISIARGFKEGMVKLTDYVYDYFKTRKGTVKSKEEILKHINFTDKYLLGGYGLYDDDTECVIKEMLFDNGIATDTTYVGKAMSGMLKYLREYDIRGKKVLFIHTGGLPLFFDHIDVITG